MKLLGLSGNKGAGKDTVAEYLRQQGWITISYADTLKNALQILFNWDKSIFDQSTKELIDPVWNTSPREMCQLLGTEFLREQCKFLNTNIINPLTNQQFTATYHIKRTHQRILDILQYLPNSNIVITDVRFQDELDYIHFMGGSIIKIDRPSLQDNQYSNHPSETFVKSLTKKDVEYYVINDGTIDDLWNKINEEINK